jgi:TusA-related sulfurtransferase
MNKIDCFGDICPIPILKMQHELELLQPGESFEMVVDHSCVIESIQDSLKKINIYYEIEEVMNGVWEIIITKPL